MKDRRVGLGIASILAISACNAIVGVEEVQPTGPSGSSSGSGGADTGGMGGTGLTGGGGMGGTGLTGGGGMGGMMPCEKSADCVTADPCLVWTCESMKCVSALAPVGEPCGQDKGKACSATGQCILALGGACSGPDECANGFCADGVCCGSACTDSCMSCNLPGNAGTCAPIPLGLDDNEPMLTCYGPTVACDGTGQCLAEIGSSCNQDANCFSGHCSSNVNGICTGSSGIMLLNDCGPLKNEPCNQTKLVPGGFYNRTNDSRFPAEVTEFSLDRFEVTIGRFRKFVTAYSNGMATPTVGSGAHPKVPDSGWNGSWQLGTSALMRQNLLNCEGHTPNPWSDNAGALENLPMPCVTWYEAFAFCTWDGGRLPTEAEWNYAAAGGDEQRYNAWSSPPVSITIDASYAVYDCNGVLPAGIGDPMANCSINDILPVGSKSPKGDGRWGHSDLGGSVYEWTRDGDSNYVTPCVDCIGGLGMSSFIIRGGGWNGPAYDAQASVRYPLAAARTQSTGFRCAYDPHPTCGNGVVDPGEFCDDQSLDPAVALGCKKCDKIKKVVAGETHACAVTELGKLKCWGDNAMGQLGQGTIKTILEPSKSPRIPLPPVDDVTLSKDRTCALLKDGAVKCFGADLVDGVGGLLGTTMAITEPQGDNPGELEKLPSISLPQKAVQIVSGKTHSCVLLEDGRVRCWGGNAMGQLGVNNKLTYQGPTPNDVFNKAMSNIVATSLAASNDSTCALLMNSGVACWGSDTWKDMNGMGRFGVLGLDNATNPARGDEPDEMTLNLLRTVLPADANPPSTIFGAGDGYCVYTNNTASVRCWGANEFGQLGRESQTSWGSGEFNNMAMLTPISLGNAFVPAQMVAGRTHACAVSADGRLKCFGDNRAGTLGLGIKPPDKSMGDYGIGDRVNEMGDSLTEVPLGTDRVKQISLGNQLTCALFQNGRVKCWGINDLGQTGVLPNDPAVGDDFVNNTPMAQPVSSIPYVEPF